MHNRPAVLEELDKVEDAIRLFDSHYDSRQLYPFVRELLKSVPCPGDTDAAELRWQFGYVGASWARIVSSVDLDYELGLGYHVHDQSIAVTDRLFKSKAEHPLDPVFGMQVLVRWYDASAKLYYRTGDHTTARAYWDKCLSALESDPWRDSLAFIYPDIKSSAERNKYEEIRQTTDSKNVSNINLEDTDPQNLLINNLRPSIVETLGYFEINHAELMRFLDPSVAFSDHEVAPLMACLTVRDRERLRGLANLYQNTFQPNHVERIAELTGDQLRLMQSLHERARTCAKEMKAAHKLSDRFSFFAKASLLWKRVRDSGRWRRGHFFARQNLALLERDFIVGTKECDDPSKALQYIGCLRELINLIDDLQRLRSDSTEFESIGDIDTHGWTVTFAYKTLQSLKNLEEHLDLQQQRALRELETRVIEELEQMVREHRKVIRVGVYKQAFAKYYRNHYQRILKHYHELFSESSPTPQEKESRLSKLVTWIEESSSRELLDMIASKRRRSLKSARITNHTPATVAEDALPEDDSAIEPVRRLRKSIDNERIREVSIKSEEEFNEFAKDNPVVAEQISPQIFQQAEGFAKEQKSILIRFFQVDEEAYGAVIFDPSKRVEVRMLPMNGTSSTPSVDYSIEILNQALDDNYTKSADIEQHLPELSHSMGRIFGELGLADRLISAKSELTSAIVIPVGKLWKLPFHAAAIDSQFIVEQVPIVYSMSLSALVNHGRSAGLVAPIGGGNLGICTSYYERQPDSIMFGAPIVKRVSSESRNSIQRLGPSIRASDQSIDVSRKALAKLLQQNLSILYLGCHGEYYADALERNCLIFHNSNVPSEEARTVYITPEQLALANVEHEIPLVIFAACVSGQGVGLPGGEVSGFYRAMAALGARTCLLSFWPVGDTPAEMFALRMIRNAQMRGNTALDCYRRVVTETSGMANVGFGRKVMKLCCFGLFV